MKNNVVMSFVTTLVIVIATLFASLAIFGALSWNEVGDNLVKVVEVAVIVVVASLLISFITKKE